MSEDGMRVITDYRVAGHGPKSLGEEVMEMIKDGWRPWGMMTSIRGIDAYPEHYQAMVKYAPKEDKPPRQRRRRGETKAERLERLSESELIDPERYR